MVWVENRPSHTFKHTETAGSKAAVAAVLKWRCSDWKVGESTPSLHVHKCPWARCWSLNCSQCCSVEACVGKWLVLVMNRRHPAWQSLPPVNECVCDWVNADKHYTDAVRFLSESNPSVETSPNRAFSYAFDRDWRVNGRNGLCDNKQSNRNGSTLHLSLKEPDRTMWNSSPAM